MSPELAAIAIRAASVALDVIEDALSDHEKQTITAEEAGRILKAKLLMRQRAQGELDRR